MVFDEDKPDVNESILRLALVKEPLYDCDPVGLDQCLPECYSMTVRRVPGIAYLGTHESPNLVGVHSEKSLAMPTRSPIDHNCFATPASIAGVTRSVWWTRTKL